MEEHWFDDDGVVPNNPRVPLVVYRGVLESGQYAAGDYRDMLHAAAIIQSMSRQGNCWDNAPMESFFGTLKTELRPPPRIPRSRYRAARPVRLYRRLLQSAAHSR